MKRLLLKTKAIVGNYTEFAPINCEWGKLSFDNQYKVLREHLRLCGLGFGVPHDFFDLGESLLDKWSKVLLACSFLPGSIDDIKETLQNEFVAEPTPARLRVRIKIKKLADPAGVRFIDLFAGIGGFHQAMSSAGGQCVFASEWDKYARQAYEANYKKSSPNLFVKEYHDFNSDINDAQPEDIPDFDVCCGGFPCQAFSIAGLVVMR